MNENEWKINSIQLNQWVQNWNICKNNMKKITYKKNTENKIFTCPFYFQNDTKLIDFYSFHLKFTHYKQFINENRILKIEYSKYRILNRNRILNDYHNTKIWSKQNHSSTEAYYNLWIHDFITKK